MLRTDLSIGDKVVFGRGRGEKTLGEIVKLNPTKAKVKTLELRGVRRAGRVGEVWSVPYGIISKASVEAQPQEKVSKAIRGLRDFSKCTFDFSKGDRVWFQGRAGKKVVGTVIRVSKKTCSVDPDDNRVPYWRVPPSMLRREGEVVKVPAPAPKRPEVEILKDLCGIEGSLSPENLSCDGELGRYETKLRYCRLMVEKRALIAELGRTPTDQEIWGISFR
jgi:hypothetical protein